MSKARTCPNCCSTIKDHPQNDCVLAALIGVIHDRGELSKRVINRLHANANVDYLWDTIGKIVDDLEEGVYDITT